MSKRSAFTLVELMIIVAILGDILLIALPSFLRSRDVAQNAQFISDLRIATAAFEMYATENNQYPPSAAPGIVPSGMMQYLKGMDWYSYTPIGGQWNWVLNSWGATAQLGVHFSSPPDDVRMSDIDADIDNGALSTGGFRKQTSLDYMSILE